MSGHNLEAARLRMRELLLAELTQEKPRDWYYVSVAGEEFAGGYFLKAHGPTDAWHLLHALGWWQEDCSTQTIGPIEEERMRKVPEDMRWRRLSRQEVDSIAAAAQAEQERRDEEWEDHHEENHDGPRTSCPVCKAEGYPKS